MNMKSRSSFCVLVFLTLCGQAQISCGQPADSNAVAVVSGSELGRPRATLSNSETAMADTKRNEEVAAAKMMPVPATAGEAAVLNDGGQRDETRAQRATRINRSIFIVAGSVLGFFVLCRLWLLWQIAQYRKGIARGNSIEN